ncbi:MAG TPA: GNAT family N-acetyltransferase [Terriglobales bacterium]|nr:GNAT family N-acetyltransferase [Terriglobales bacterium]
MTQHRPKVVVRTTRPEDFVAIDDLTREVYPGAPTWSHEQLSSHMRVFPAGQLVAVEADTQKVVGMAASLIVYWDDYDLHAPWRDFTDHGMFTNHDPERGRTLYGAEVMVQPSRQGRGIGKKLYQARRELVQGLGLLRIRAGARLRHYHRYAHRMSAEDYVIRILQGKLRDPTLSFQLKEGFEVLGVVAGYLQHDPESLGYAAVIEWLNPLVARPEDSQGRDPRFWNPDSGTALASVATRNTKVAGDHNAGPR